MTKITNNPGLLPLQLGQTQISNDYWSYIQVLDLSPLIDEFRLVQNQYKRLKTRLIQNKSYQQEYTNSFPLIDNLEQKITNQIFQLNPEDTSHARHKRGIVNGLGSILKIITGNLDQEDAQKYDDQISFLTKNHDKIKSILSEQVTILNSTITNFNNIITNISHNQIILESRILQIESALDKLLLEETNNYQYFLTHAILTQITFLLQNIYDIFERIEVATTFSKLNTLHNSIINPLELLNEIKATDKFLTGTKLPFEPEISNILKYEKIINIKSYSKGHIIVFILEIPLTEVEAFQFFELYTMPVKTNDTYQILNPKTKYVALSNKHYVYITNDCIYVDTSEYLCRNTNPVVIHEHAPCEIALLSFSKDLNDCHPIKIEITDLLIQKIKPSRWIVIIPEETTITQTCDKIISKYQLQGTFIITLNKHCKIIINNQILQTHTVDSYNVKFDLPQINISFDKKPKITYNPGPLQLETINNHKLLANQISLDKQAKDIQKINQTSISYSTSIWTIFLYIILIALIVYTIYIKFSKHCIKLRQPIIVKTSESASMDNTKNQIII